MNLRAPLFALICFAPSPCLLAAQDDAATIAVSRLVQDFRAAEEAYDPMALGKLIEERFVEISPAGEVDPHDRFLGFYAPEKKQPFPSNSASEEQIRIFGDSAVDTLKLTFSMPGPDGVSHARSIRATYLAHRQAGTWKLIGTQFTGIRPVPLPQQ